MRPAPGNGRIGFGCAAKAGAVLVNSALSRPERYWNSAQDETAQDNFRPIPVSAENLSYQARCRGRSGTGIGEKNMPTLEEIKKRFAKDLYATEITGIEIIEAAPGKAVCRLPVRPGLLNANGVPMGGALFTLADFAFAVAANGHSESNSVSQHASITFLSPARGQILTAEAECLKAGRRTCLYQVKITDETGVYVAHMTVNGFTV